jgi:DNA-binding transcriptional ArsR family regulator
MNTAALRDVTTNAADAAQLLRTLSSAPRLLVMCHLAAAGELAVGELVKRVGLSQSALSQHLAKLRTQGVVACRRQGQSLRYRVADRRTLRLLELLQEMFCPELDENPGDIADRGEAAPRALPAPRQRTR